MVSEERIQSEIKLKLKSRIFLGTYEKRVFVSDINDYRSVVILSPSETELSMDLMDVSRILNKYYKDTKYFFGFSTENKSIIQTTGLLYVDELDDEPFGHFWFQIKSIKFKNSEVKLKLKVLRSVGESDYNSSTNTSTFKNNMVSRTLDENSLESIEWNVILTSWVESASASIKRFLYYDINVQNIKKTINNITLLILGLVACSLQFVKYVGIFTLQFMAELSRLIHVCMPLFFGVLDLFSRIIGGLFIFMTMLWKDSIGGNKRIAIKPNQPGIRPAINYR
uniref:CSON006823 protein n=1 Tax=Culicoides sonorensis TaxID=179676 RepID=A0A336M1X3_CULSO